MNSSVSGAIDVFDMSAVSVMHGPDNGTHTSDSIGRCVFEPDLYIYENADFFQRKEFLGSKCCETCEADQNCLYAISTGRDCYIASHVEAESVGILNTEILRNNLRSYWMDDAVRRGDFCNLCECRQSELTIDCSNRDLKIVPKTFTPASGSDWIPRKLDLTGNSRLVIIGSGSLDAISENLEELILPGETRHISLNGLRSLPALKTVLFESYDEFTLSNVITDPSGAYTDVCCTRGDHIELGKPAGGLTFCELEAKYPGVDSSYLPFIEFPAATPFQVLRPSSGFMAEAAESVEKCAEFCTITSECKYFSYDARLPNAEHVCMLLEDMGTGPFKVCCDADHYADDAKKVAGWISVSRIHV